MKHVNPQSDSFRSKETVAIMDSAQHPLDAIGSAVEADTVHESLSSIYTDHNTEDQYSEQLVVEPTIIPRNLSLAGLQTPALMLDNEMRVFWQNRLAVDQIWHHARAAGNGKRMPLIFDLLLDPQFQRTVDNWRQWMAFFIHHLAHMMPQEMLQNRIEQINPRQKNIVSPLVERMLNISDLPAGCLRQILADGEIRQFRVVALDFKEGRLLSFAPATTGRNPADLVRVQDVVQRFERILRQPNPIRTAYCTLCASLDQASLLKTELLSYEYCILMNELCNRSIAIAERFGGVFVKNNESGFSVCFLPADEYADDATDNVIACALALRSQMIELSREWKIRRAWPHELALNIGIHQEREYLGILTTSLGACFAGFGNALNIASDLSRLARNGQIWATKALINDMPVSDRKHLKFGIYRSGVNQPQILQQNGFSKVRDLTGGADLSSGIFKETGEMAVTQILDFNSAC
jgi:class 3 adenylate cyclase